jgi:hypothetical protein
MSRWRIAVIASRNDSTAAAIESRIGWIVVATAPMSV